LPFGQVIGSPVFTVHVYPSMPSPGPRLGNLSDDEHVTSCASLGRYSDRFPRFGESDDVNVWTFAASVLPLTRTDGRTDRQAPCGAVDLTRHKPSRHSIYTNCRLMTSPITPSPPLRQRGLYANILP